MATYLTDEAICLRVTDFSETSQIVGLFTRPHGLVPMIAKGSKRASKKGSVSGPLDLLTSGEVVFVPAKGGGSGAELSTLASWELIDHRGALRKDLAGLDAAMLCAEVTTLLMHPHDAHGELFGELEATLELLGTNQRPRAAVAYVKAALEAAGYAPQLDRCLVCGKPLEADGALRFYPRAGGLVSGACQVQGHGEAALTIAGRIVVALRRLPAPRALLAAPPQRAADAQALARAMEMLLCQVEAVSERALRTRYLLESIFGRSRFGI